MLAFGKPAMIWVCSCSFLFAFNPRNLYESIVYESINEFYVILKCTYEKYHKYAKKNEKKEIGAKGVNKMRLIYINLHTTVTTIPHATATFQLKLLGFRVLFTLKLSMPVQLSIFSVLRCHLRAAGVLDEE